jgi:N-[(2S)-2-amino-2-carboxyethyl]-L-glutamate dehydrogenase
MFEFNVIGGQAVHELLASDLGQVVAIVEDAYRSHGAGHTVNPPSQFLRFPDRPNARIIALPAYLGGDSPVSGIKWIASFPDNIQQGVPRASAVLLLNHADTGYPYACIEASIISAARTAASAVLGARWLNGRTKSVKRLGFIGAGVIARYIFDFFVKTGWDIGRTAIFDAVPEYAASFQQHALREGRTEVEVHGSADAVIGASDMTVFATTAPAPYVSDPRLFAHCPRILNISLRDLAPEILLAADNIVDDIDHCLTANTSPHLAEQLSGSRSFVTGTLCQLMAGHVTLRSDRPAIFSPFGMGILDLAVAKYIHDKARALDKVTKIDNFFHERNRW